MSTSFDARPYLNVTLCTYLIANDTGLAPNPYHGWCSLAVCTPNHQGARLTDGDWIAGFLTKARGYKLVYVLQIEQRLHLNKYFRDPRFAAKRPNLRGDWRARCGDNFYSQDREGHWKQHRNRFHIGEAHLKKDTRRPYVFVGRRFWYFGREALDPPPQLGRLWGGRGIRVNHDPVLVEQLLQWVSSGWKEGIHGLPNDNPDLAA